MLQLRQLRQRAGRVALAVSNFGEVKLAYATLRRGERKKRWWLSSAFESLGYILDIKRLVYEADDTQVLGLQDLFWGP